MSLEALIKHNTAEMNKIVSVLELSLKHRNEDIAQLKHILSGTPSKYDFYSDCTEVTCIYQPNIVHFKCRVVFYFSVKCTFSAKWTLII